MKEVYIYSLLSNFTLIDGVCYASNPLINVEVECSLPSSLIFQIINFCRIKRTLEEIKIYIHNKNINKDLDPNEMISYLICCGIIIRYDLYKKYIAYHSPCSYERELKAYLSSRRSVPHADYSDPGIYKNDKHLMEIYSKAKDYPCPYKKYTYKNIISLLHPAYRESYKDDFPYGLTEILFWNFGVLKKTVFLDFLPIYLKSVPSKGARHPFDVYIIIPSTYDYLKGDLYHYIPEYHALGLLEREKYNIDKNTSFSLLITCVFERFQWRYRHFFSYKDIFYDLGHLIENITYVASKMNLHIQKKDNFYTFSYETLLQEEVLSETVFYKKEE